MNHKVLIPLDGSDFSAQILPYVQRFHPPADNELVLVRVAAPPPQQTGFAPPSAMPADLWAVLGRPVPVYAARSDVKHGVQPARTYIDQDTDTLQAHLVEDLQPVAQRLQEHGYDVSVVVRFGDPATEIVAVVREEDIDLVAMATHGRIGSQRIVQGSVAEYVVRHVSVPVTLVRPFAHFARIQSPGEILAERLVMGDPLRLTAVIDGSPSAQTTLAFVGNLARALTTELTILFTAEAQEDVVQTRHLLDATLETLGGVQPPPRVVPLAQYADTFVLRYLEEHLTDLLVIGPVTHETPVNHATIGYTAQHLLHHAPTSVLIVKGRRPVVDVPRKVLACTTVGDDITVDVAARFAQTIGAELRVLHVVPSEAAPYITSSTTAPVKVEQVVQQDTLLAQHVQASLERLAAVEFNQESLVVRHGTVPEIIFEEAQAGAHDLVVIGSRASPGHVLGTVANYVVQYAYRPVFVVRTTA